MDRCVWCGISFDGNEQAEIFDEKYPSCWECLFIREDIYKVSGNSEIEDKIMALAVNDENGLSIKYNHADRVWNIHVDGATFTAVGLFSLDDALKSALNYVNVSVHEI